MQHGAIHVQEADGPEQEEPSEKLAAVIGRLQSEADKRVMARQPWERQWLADLRQKHGRYAEDEEVILFSDQEKQNGSRLFLNQTRPKTNSLSARLSDILFPTDDRNWALNPTPVPEMEDEASTLNSLRKDANDTMQAAKARETEASLEGDSARLERAQTERAQAEKVIDEVADAEAELAAVKREARRKCDLMQEEIDDQLKASKHNRESRKVIQDACDVGIGVMKGPVVGLRTKKRWVKAENQDGSNVISLRFEGDRTPSNQRVNYWSFFPDPDVADIEDGEGVFERHLMNSSKFRKLQRRGDIDKDALRRVLRQGPRQGNQPTYLNQLNDITGNQQVQTTDYFIVWEYSGPIDGEDIEILTEQYGVEGFEHMFTDDGEVDPLAEMQVRIWFCQGEVLAFAPHPLDSGECLYSTFRLEPDENSPWGFGIPYLMRHPQALLNAAVRMMSDNAGWAAGPQIVVNKNVVTPENGSWILEGRKLWVRRHGDAGPNERPFETFSIDMHQAELANIMEIALQQIDDVTIPSIAQGEQGAEVTKTAQGMAMLMNSANVVFRRWVKNFDDFVTKPTISRMYEFNMLHSEKDEIKGDYETDVRGSSVLLVREMQAQNMMMILDRYIDHPVYGPMLREREAFEHMLRAHMMPVSEMLRTKDEYDAELERRANQPSMELQAAELQMQAAELDRQIRQAEIESKERISSNEWGIRERIAMLEAETELQSLAEKLNMSMEELKAKTGIAMAGRDDRTAAARIAAEQKDRSLATEVAMRERTGESAGGAV